VTAQARQRGQRLREVRNACGWTQERLGQEAGLSTYHVWQLEHGQREGLTATWIALAGALEVHPLHLLALPATAEVATR
jgi:transcriptional regulator with XRE-family HTH domain